MNMRYRLYNKVLLAVIKLIIFQYETSRLQSLSALHFPQEVLLNMKSSFIRKTQG